MIHNGFGLAAFAILPYMVFMGLYLLLNFRPFSLLRILLHTIIFMTWFSLFLGFVFQNMSPLLGGTFGYFGIQQLQSGIGVMGAFVFLAVFAFIYYMVIVNANPFESLQMKAAQFEEDFKSEETGIQEEQHFEPQIFEDITEEGSLLPGTPAARAEARRLVDWFQGKFEREVVRPVLKEKHFRRMTGDGVPSSQIIRAAMGNLSSHMEYLNFLVERRKWLAGSKLTLADLHAAASLSVLDFLGDIFWQDWPEAKTWYSRIKSRPSFRPLLADSVTGLTPPEHYADLDF
ncbi:MAG: hypothetical protein EBT93_12680 [Alphaproteobacteria bacterium]|nr:hypothetical protein [Alphaproteobacteria bacterium]